MMPAIDGDTVRLLREAIGQDDIFFNAGNEQPKLFPFPLALDDFLMLIERGCGFAIFRERLRLELDFGLAEDFV